MANFSEFRRAQLAKSTFATSTLGPLGSFQFFKVFSNATERVGCGNQREVIASIQSRLKLQPWFLSLRWKTCLRQNCILDSCACSEGLSLEQKTLLMVIMYIIMLMIVCRRYILNNLKTFMLF